jgi:hypothetical protein
VLPVSAAGHVLITRRALGSNLVAEYELERITVKHTRIQSRRSI